MRLPLATALTLASLAPTTPALAQLGVKAGLSFATLSESSTSPDFRNQTGFAAGVSLGLPLGGVFVLQPEALYAEKGAKGATSSNDLKVAYLDVPLLLRLTIPTPGLAPFAVGGPQASFQLRCELGQSDCDQDFAGTDYGVAVGAGVRIGGGLGFTVEARYTQGLKDINRVSQGFDSKTRTFFILAGLSF
jgi:hypothetical protein